MAVAVAVAVAVESAPAPAAATFATCAKVGVACVGYDPITKREIPRSYVYYLETRVAQLEALLRERGVPFPPAEDLEGCSREGRVPARADGRADGSGSGSGRAERTRDASSKPRSLASTSGVSFARVVLAAVQHTASESYGGTDRQGHHHHHHHRQSQYHNPSHSRSQNQNHDQIHDRHGNQSHTQIGPGPTSMRDSFFGLHTKPRIQPATFPGKDVAMRLVTLYFEHANPQIPILHRGEFMRVFEQAYAAGRHGPQDLSAREQYMLNMVFAIGCGVIVGEPVRDKPDAMRGRHEDGGGANGDDEAGGTRGPCRPEEYHASAIVHLEECLSSSGGGLEVLQAVLLLANFALLRPVPPGLWYIIGVAVRLAVDLGLHHEEGGDEAGGGSSNGNRGSSGAPGGGTGQLGQAQEVDRGRRLWARDLRRRLWWCTYSFDRLVSTCVGRPFGISDQVVTTELPSILDDDHITPAGFLAPPRGHDQPSYKRVAHHYFRLRKLQSEILQVLQYNQAVLARTGGGGGGGSSNSQAHPQPQPRITYPEMSKHVPCPYLVHFDSFRSWRADIDRRLWAWKTSAPTRMDTGVAFSTEFLELNYWQAIILLYRQSLSIPAVFQGEYDTSHEVNSPAAFTAELREDEDRIYLKVAEAGQKILRIYRQLHLNCLVSYTYLSTHHLFMAGIAYLYAIWHSPTVRSRLTMDEVDFTILAAKSVFTDMIDKCPPAETCRDAFDRTAKATIKMANANGGFGAPVRQQHFQQRFQQKQQQQQQQQQQQHQRARRRDPAWAPSDTSFAQAPRHRHIRPEQGFPFDMTVQNGGSPTTISPYQDGDDAAALSVATTKAFDGQGSPQGPHENGGTDGGFLDRQQQQQQQQHYGVPGPLGYADAAQHLDYSYPLGGVGVEQGHMGMGLAGMGWEGMQHDYGEGGQMNPFDAFFFGGQQQQQQQQQ
ncbi:Positive regulator of purine utilization [Escovopsis weberi]|uniref:Positive regulator of purine utilization n=1 Tax=Escovopsis weberi TaxID=150374 RepID=A0A0M9VSJ8_ESCWE|nr:Positive regulator of purine utilization [Escovopsis weberi]